MRFLLAFVFVFVAYTTANAQEANGVMMVVKGDVSVTSKEGKTEAAKVGKKVVQGDTITAGKDSRAKIVMSDKNVINVSPDSKIKIEKYEAGAQKNVELKVEYGKVRASVEQKYDGEKSKFNIKTPSAVAGVRGTDFLTGYNPQTKVSQVVTFSGSVAMGTMGPGGSIQNPVFVKPGQMAEAGAGQAPSAPKPVPKEDLNKMNSDTNSDSAAAKQDNKPADQAAKNDEKKEEKKEEPKKDEQAKKDEPKKDEGKKEEAKQDQAKKDDVKKEEPKKEEPKQEQAKKDEPKKDNKAPAATNEKKDEPKKDQAANNGGTSPAAGGEQKAPTAEGGSSSGTTSSGGAVAGGSASSGTAPTGDSRAPASTSTGTGTAPAGSSGPVAGPAPTTTPTSPSVGLPTGGMISTKDLGTGPIANVPTAPQVPVFTPPPTIPVIPTVPTLPPGVNQKSRVTIILNGN